MHSNLKPFEDRHDARLLNKAEFEDLVLYKYSNHCVYEKAWDEYTRISRGIIFNKNTGELVARPFPKFFNLHEMPETRIENLPDIKPDVFQKLDGSLGIMYKYINNGNSEYRLATPGSFDSAQAIMGTRILQKRLYAQYKELNINDVYLDRITLLFEIIYPSNKIVCDYNGMEDIILLAAFEIKSGRELSRQEVSRIAHSYDFNIVDCYHYMDLNQSIRLSKEIDKNQEGFVLRYPNGLRVKIKGHEYLKFHKFIDGITPLNIWAEMENGQLKQSYKEQVPEEFRDKVEEIEGLLVEHYNMVKDEIKKEILITWKNVHRLYIDVAILKNFPSEMGSGPGPTDEEIYDGLLKAIPITYEPIKKLIGIFLNKNPGMFKHQSTIFPFLLGKQEAVEKYIMKYIRPDSNNIII